MEAAPTNKERPTKLVVQWIILLLAGAVAVAPLIPPRPTLGADDASFSTDRALVTIGRVATKPHPIGSAANRQVRDAIVGQIRELGLEPKLQSIEAPDYFGKPGNTIAVTNVMTRIPGTASTGVVMLMGHYDTVPTSPGATDDSSAVAVMLETARAVLNSPALRNDVIFLFTDGEEPAPRFGSSAFLASHPWADDVAFVINLEAIGTGGPSNLLDTSGPRRWIINQYAQVAPYPVAFSYLTATTELIGGSNTDFSPFRDAGIPGLELVYLHGSSIYHTLADALDRVSVRSLHHQGSNTLAFTRYLADIDLGQPNDDSETVFFTVGRFLVLGYPASAALPLVVLAGIALAAAVWRKRALGRLPWSVAGTALTLLVTALVMIPIWTVLAGWRNTMGIAESYSWLAGILALTIGISAVAKRLLKRKVPAGADAAGVVTVWWLMAMLIGLVAPGIGYLFLWPALVGALLLLWQDGNQGWRELAAFAFLTTITLMLLVPAIDTFYQLAQPRPGNLDSQILSLIAIPVLLISLVVELLRGFKVANGKRSDLTHA